MRRRNPFSTLLAAMAGLLLAPAARAAHPLFVQILVADTSRGDAEGAPRLREVALGIPIPRAAGIGDASRILVVGAEWNQAIALSWWPEGTIRWVLVTFPVWLRPGERSTGWYVATGSARRSRPRGMPRAARDGAVAQTVSAAVYDHAGVFPQAVPRRETPPETEALTAMSLPDLLLAHLGCTAAPTCAVIRVESRERVATIMAADSTSARDAYGLTLWHVLTGDITAWHRARLWGKGELQRAATGELDEDRALGLLELYASTRDDRHLDCARDRATSRAATVLESFLGPAPPPIPAATPVAADPSAFRFEAGDTGGSRARLVHTTSYEVSLTPEPDPIPRNRLFSLIVRVKARVAGAKPTAILVDADMPAHRHGMPTAPVVHDLGDGRFRVDGMLMHMLGAWEITVDVASDDSLERATFPWNVE